MDERLGNAATVLPNYDVLLPVIRDAAARVAPNHMAADLEEIVFQELLDHPARFDPSKSKLTTYINTIAKRRAIDMMRRQESRERRELAAAKPEMQIVEAEAQEVDVKLPLLQYAAEVYRNALYTAGARRPGRGPQVFQPAQMITLVAVKQRLNISARGLVDLLESRSDLRAAMRLHAIPRYRNILISWARCRGRSTKNRVGHGRIRAKARYQSMARANGPIIDEATAAGLMGVSASTLKAWRYEKRSPVPYMRVGDSIRYSRVEVEKYLASCTVQPTQAAGN